MFNIHANEPIRQLCTEFIDQGSINIDKTPWDTILQRNEEIRHRVPKKARKSIRTYIEKKIRLENKESEKKYK
jgi:hypothetical protein